MFAVTLLEKAALYYEIKNAIDDLFTSFKIKWLSLDEMTIKAETGIQPQYAKKISDIIQNGEINSMITLANYDGIGEKTLEKAFNYVLNSPK